MDLIKNLQRGDIYYIKESPDKDTVGTEIWSNRPGLVVSNDVYNEKSGFVEIVYLTTSENRKNDSPTHVRVTSGNKTAIAICEQIHTVDISRLGNKLGNATKMEMKEISKALMFSLGIHFSTQPDGMFKKWEKYIKTMNLDVDFQEKTNSSKSDNQLQDKINTLKEERDGYKKLASSSLNKIDKIRKIIE